MMGFLWLLAATLASMELLARIRVIDDFVILSRLGRRAGTLLIRRGVSEWAKEKAMRLLAWRLLTQSFASLSALLLVAAPLILVLALDGIAGLGVRAAWSSIPARTALLVLSTLYMIARKRNRRRPGDAFGERKLQRIALGTRFVPELSFDLERQLYLREAEELPLQPPIFVTGLARAGTTVIMRALHQSGGFAALTYRDLPFPLAPNLWARLGKPLRHAVAAAERAHGDGVLHDLDSPEAIEEMFWRHHEGGRYCRADGLSPVAPREETIDDFVDYVRLVQLRYKRPRYLSKNNNNVLRLPALIAAFPDAQLIHPFRDPAQQAASLLNQHRRACRLAAGDPFRARFMTWLGHHEFGADRRRLLLPGGPAG
ncbi:MAG TPA: sulfotransferase, partial [Sphingomonas sp.]|uniref:sulfotransferase n=1 Tax=Sphingomonas sp. TaxID=28214 RepID=UPI002C756E9A